MSWAANRITKRVEDRAYSLLGLFDVNMAMIYGEREKAFLRLQQHIIQKCRDESIFAWAMDDSMGEYWSIYAPSPSFFSQLSINLPVRSCSPSERKALLNCTSEFHPDSRFYIITTITQDSKGYVRVRDSEGKSEGLISAHSIRHYHPTLLRFPIDPRRPPNPIFYGFWLHTLQPPGNDETTPMILSSAEPPEPDHVRQTNRRANTGIVHFKAQGQASTRPPWSQIRWMKVGFDADYNPVTTSYRVIVQIQ
ncbi:hypothetical protein BU24DRAFT_466618 [Aaosphaeria arxii CBS 175.79]|uniref:DUF8212 domain-containing protein n=1 Tax=Aaosphaeria arxii CBS 175.79 TaxID=1450172 RepID=A0A6A5XDK7_9PLEO|nr:uncharacterized protein BU24DRAFT_466618 [Aaosphaeria arxii CBS 175.79]KAF2010854.1 hypothetical protein BU24DRAFT_466618 [Aaosphaeria arxii CBS 175.79]